MEPKKQEIIEPLGKKFPEPPPPPAPPVVKPVIELTPEQEAAKKKEETAKKKEETLAQILAALKEYNNMESEIPHSHPYWGLLNAYRAL